MPYSKDNPPLWSKNKSDAVKQVSVRTFNEEFKRSGSEQKARRASLAAMVNAEKAFKKSKVIQKSLNEEKQIATFIVLEPQDPDLTTDLHADTYDAETIADACYQFNKNMHLRKANLHHAVDTDGYEFLESYILPADMSIENKIIKAGTWLMTLRCSDWIWAGIKSGAFNGVSVQCKGTVEDL